MKAGANGGGEAELLARLDAGLAETWDALVAAVGGALIRWPAYRRMEPAELRASANGLAMLLRAAVAGKRLGRDDRARLATVFSERLQLGLAPEQLRAAVHAAAAAGYLHLWLVASAAGIDQPGAVAAVHRAVLRLWAMANDVQEVVAVAAGRSLPLSAPAATTSAAAKADADAGAGNKDGEDLAALQRRVFGRAALRADTNWGLIGVVPGRYQAADLVEAGEVVATATGGACAPVRSEPVSHVMVLVPVPGPASGRTAWEGTVDAAAQALWWQGAAVLAAPAPACATDIPATDQWLRACLRYSGVLPGATGVARGQVELYADAEAVPPAERLRRFRQTVGPLLADRNGPRLLAALDALAAFDDDRRAVAGFLGTSELAVQRQIGEVAQATGLQWDEASGRHMLHRAVVYRWMAAAFDNPYHPAWGPVPVLRELACQGTANTPAAAWRPA